MQTIDVAVGGTIELIGPVVVDMERDGMIVATAEQREPGASLFVTGVEGVTVLLVAGHICEDNPAPYVSDGPLGHGWECAVCGRFLQAG